MAKKKGKKRKRSRNSRKSTSPPDKRGETNPRASRLETKSVGECDAIDDREGKASVPIELSVAVAASDRANKGWSWGAAFAAASKIQTEDVDSDHDFLSAAAAVGGSGENGVVDISELVKDHETRMSKAPDDVDAEDSPDRSMKRKRSKSSTESNDYRMKSNDNADSDGTNSDDLSLEGRLVPIVSAEGSSNECIVLVQKKTGKVFSSGERTLEGHRLVIGKFIGGNVELDPFAIGHMRLLDERSPPHRQDHTRETALIGQSFPYPTNPDDHCETPLRSYKDILPILNELCESFSVEKHSMKIYDPYFCDGSVAKNLSSLGFSRANVYNKKEDCYAVWKSRKEPQFHVFLTNPPYSGDHIEKLLEYLISPSFGDRPWMLLMPQWVHKKRYYCNATTKNKMNPCNPFYIVPRKRYVYLPPANFREKKESDTHKKSSPFVSIWYCWGGTEDRNKKLIDAFRRSTAGDCDLARSKSALRDLRRRIQGIKSKPKKARAGRKVCVGITIG